MTGVQTCALPISISHFDKLAHSALEKGVPVQRILEIDSKEKIGEVKFEREYEKKLAKVHKEMESEIAKLE